MLKIATGNTPCCAFQQQNLLVSCVISASASRVERRTDSIDSHPKRTLFALRGRLAVGKIPAAAAVATKNAIFVYICELFGLIEKVKWFSTQRKLICEGLTYLLHVNSFRSVVSLSLFAQSFGLSPNKKIDFTFWFNFKFIWTESELQTKRISSVFSLSPSD